MAATEVASDPTGREAPAISNVDAAKIRALLPIEVLLVTTTPVERDALREALRPLPGETALLRGDTPTITLGRFGQYGVAHVECAPGSGGRDGSMLTVSAAIRLVRPKAILVLGIAFGVDPDKQRPGDVLVADTVIPYEAMREGNERIPRGKPLHAGFHLAERFRTRIDDWPERHEDRPVRVYRGQVLSGEKLIDNRVVRDALLGHFPEAIGGEMEGAGAYAAAAQENVEIILIKSICDFADGFKTDDAQPSASHTAVSLALHVLGQPGALAPLGVCDRWLPGSQPRAVERHVASARSRLLQGIDLLPHDWHDRIGNFIDAYVGTVERGNVFCGRESDVDHVRAWLDRENATPNLLLAAPAGRGKSALMVRLAMALSARDDFDVVFIPWSLRFETHRSDVFFRCLVARLYFLRGRPPPDLRNTTVDMLKRMFLDELAHPHPEGRKLVVLLDGLDEATELDVWPGLFPGRHPRSVRIVVAVRHQPDDPDGSIWKRKLGWDKRDIAETMQLPPLALRDVEATLARLAPPLNGLSQRRDIIAELNRLCAGDPLTLWLLIGWMVDQGPAALDLDISLLRSREHGIGTSFALWWDLQCKQWGDQKTYREPAVRALLDILAVAEGGLNQDDLLALLPDKIEDSHLLHEALTSLSRLVHGDGRTSGYVLAHPGFGQYLRDRLTDGEKERTRAKLAAWIEKRVADLQQKRVQPAKISRYIVLHRAAHLKDSQASVESWLSLATREWYDAWQAHEQGPSGFLHGVKQAWEAIAASGDHIAAEAQCALVLGSIGSTLVHVTPDLLKLLLEEGIWTTEQAFAYLREAPVKHHPEENRGKLLSVLAPRIPDSLLPEFFGVACSLEETTWGRLEGNAYQDLLERMARLHPTETRIAIARFKSPSLRAVRLLDLARHWSEEKRPALIEEALLLARQGERPENRAYVLERIAAEVPEPRRASVLSEAFSWACRIEHTNTRCASLAHLATILPAELRSRAVEAFMAAAAHLPEFRLSYLERIFERSSEPWRSQALETIEKEVRASPNPSTCISSCRRVLLALPPSERARWLDLTFETILRISDESARVRATLCLLEGEESEQESELRRDIAERAMQVARGIEGLWARVGLLHPLRGLVPNERLWREMASVWPALVQSLRTDHSYDDIGLHEIVSLAPREMALEAARKAHFPWVRAKLLVFVASRFPVEERANLLDEILQALASVVSPKKRKEILWSVLFLAPPEQQDILFQDLVRTIEAIEDPYDACSACLNLASVLNEPFRSDMLAAARKISREEPLIHMRFDLLLDIARHEQEAQRASLLHEARGVAEQETQGSFRRNHLVDLAKRVEGPARRELLEEALRAAREVGDEAERARAMITYSHFLPAEELDALVTSIEEIPASEERARVYLDYLTRCEGEREKRFKRALAAARLVDHHTGMWPRASFLAPFIDIAPASFRASLVDEILDAAQEDLASLRRVPPIARLEEMYPRRDHLHVEEETAKALARLSPHVPVERIPDALAIAGDIEDLVPRARATVSLALRLGEAERREFADSLLSARLPLRQHLDPVAIRAEVASLAALLLPEPRRSEILAPFANRPDVHHLLEQIWPQNPRTTARDVSKVDEELERLVADQSRGNPHDPRLEALAAVAVERLRYPDPPRERLRKLLHDALLGRAETRSDVLCVLSAMSPLIVALGGAEAATGVVRAIRRVGEWWP